MTVSVEIIRQAITKVTKMLAGMEVEVTQRGDGAFVQYDKRTGKPVRVNIPFLPDGASEQLIAAVQGFLDHEVAHVLFTDPAAQAEDKRLDKMHGIVEDCFIERLMAQRFRGAGYNLGNVRKLVFDTRARPAIDMLIATGNTNEALMFTALNVTTFRALAGHPECIAFLDDGDKWQYMPNVLKALDFFSDDLAKCTNSFDTLELARKTLKALEDINDQDDQDDDDQDDDQEGEDGEDGEESDKPSKSKSKSKPKSKPEKNDKDDDEKSSDDSDDEEKEQNSDSSDGDDSSNDEKDGEDESEADSGDDEGNEDESDGDGADDGDEDGDSSDSDKDGEDSDENDGDSDSGSGDSESDDSDGDQSGDDDEEGDVGNSSSSSNGGSDGDDSAESSEKERVDVEMILDGIEESQDFSEQLSAEVTKVYQDLSQEGKFGEWIIFSREYDDPKPYPASNVSLSSVTDMQDEVNSMVGPMAKQLERLILARKRTLFEPGKRRGRLHSANLHRIQAGDDRIFRKKFEHKMKDTAVEILTDMSGSMQGSKMKTAAYSSYALASMLQRVNIPCEVMTFTTGHGDSKYNEEMQEAMDRLGRPFSHVGVCKHFLMKGFNERIDTSVTNRFAHLGCGDGDRHMWANCDPESVYTAGVRLAKRPEKRRILMVLSDGYPAFAGDGYSGGRRLKEVIADCEASGMDVIGIGIQDQAVREFYPKHVVLQRATDLPAAIMGEMQALLLR